MRPTKLTPFGCSRQPALREKIHSGHGWGFVFKTDFKPRASLRRVIRENLPLLQSLNPVLPRLQTFPRPGFICPIASFQTKTEPKAIYIEMLSPS